MKIELLLVPDCPHAGVAGALLRQALDDIGLSHKDFDLVIITSQEIADDHGFAGSPTFTCDGKDLFPLPGVTPAVACRLYDENGPLPPLPALRRALKQAAAAQVTALR